MRTVRLGSSSRALAPLTPLLATPFVNGLAQQGILEYPLFGISILKDGGGTFSLGRAPVYLVVLPADSSA